MAADENGVVVKMKKILEKGFVKEKFLCEEMFNALSHSTAMIPFGSDVCARW